MLTNKVPIKYKNYNIRKIESGASRRLFFRLSKKSESVILMDSSKEKNEYKNYLKINRYLSNFDISIPKVYEEDNKNNILILEDFGKLRFDKILYKYSLKNLLKYAVNALIILKNEAKFNTEFDLTTYSYDDFKSEISEFVDYYLPYLYKKKISNDLKNEFYSCWTDIYQKIDFDFNNFVHKDFNINNLMYLPARGDHLKCGILDFQNAFWGEDCWDLFSLLEDSRVFFDDSYNEYFIEYYYNNSNQKINIEEFKEKYYFLNCSRQTRLMGRWVKLSNDLNHTGYLNFLDVTKKRLFKGINRLNRKNLKLMFKKLFINF